MTASGNTDRETLPRYDGQQTIYWLDDDLLPRVSTYYWTQQLWDAFDWWDPWNLASDRRKAWELRRDRAIDYFEGWILISGSTYQGQSVDGPRPRHGPFRMGDIVRDLHAGRTMRVTSVREDGAIQTADSVGARR